MISGGIFSGNLFFCVAHLYSFFTKISLASKMPKSRWWADKSTIRSSDLSSVFTGSLQQWDQEAKSSTLSVFYTKFHHPGFMHFVLAGWELVEAVSSLRGGLARARRTVEPSYLENVKCYWIFLLSVCYAPRQTPWMWKLTWQ